MLRVFYDTSIDNKRCAFSLDPYDPTNPNGEFLAKVLYPDARMNRKIIAGTRFSELLFECDFFLKKMSLGVEEDCKTLFSYPPELKNKGLMPIHEI